MATTYKTPPNGSATPRAKLAAGETGSLGIGTPVTVTRYPLLADASDQHEVKVCANGERPDAVVYSAIDETTIGTIAYLDTGRIPLRMGAAVAAATPSSYPLLKVSGGRFIPAATGDRGYVRPRVAAGTAIASGDIVNGFASEGVVP